MVWDPLSWLTEYWFPYVFGSDILIAGVVFLFFLTLWGIKSGWSGDVFIVLMVPMIFMLALPSTGFGMTSLWGIILIGLGFLIGLGLLALIRKH